MRLAMRMLATGQMGRAPAASYPPVTVGYSSPGGAGDYADASTIVAARAVFAGTAKPVCSIVQWAKVVDSFYGTLFSATDDDAPHLRASASDEPAMSAYVANAAGTSAGGDFTAAFTGDWQVFATVCDGTDIIAYLDGASMGSATLPAADYATVDAFYALWPETGALNRTANFAIFTRALTALEIAAIHTAGVASDIRNVVDPTGLAVYWRDADTAGSVANAGSGGACALTFHGAVATATL